MISFQHSIDYGGSTVESIQVSTTIEVPTLLFAAADSEVSREFGGATVTQRVPEGGSA